MPIDLQTIKQTLFQQARERIRKGCGFTENPQNAAHSADLLMPEAPLGAIG
ncbi:hypothetical protein [Brevibacillus massiliensis]|uniref:hypothetical protein n=1 Tax=Brevibacillus massiliensis TaxID=1118054 RepID=UPI0002E2FDC5|nr:hypothetical protein [Brevibacillus massiliensis]